MTGFAGDFTGKLIEGVDYAVYPINTDIPSNQNQYIKIKNRIENLSLDCDKTLSYAVTVGDVEITGIEVTHLPQIVFDQYDTFDSTGLEVTINYNNGTTEVTTDYEIIPPNMSLTGPQTVTILYESFSTSYTIYIGSLQSIEVTHLPNNTTYFEEETISYEGLVVTGTWSSGYVGPIDDYTVSDPVFNGTDGTQSLTVTVGELTDTFDCTCYNITGLNCIYGYTQQKFEVGGIFNSTGLIVRNMFTVGSSTQYHETTIYTVSSPDMNTAGTQAVSISKTTPHGEVVTSYNITVNQVNYITHISGRTSFIVTEEFEYGGYVRVYYVSGSAGGSYRDLNQNEYTVIPPDMNTAGTKQVVINYMTYSCTYDIIVEDMVSIAVTTLPTKTTFWDTDNFTRTGLVVTAYDSNSNSTVVTSRVTVTPPSFNTYGAANVIITLGPLSCSYQITINPNQPETINSVSSITGIYQYTKKSATFTIFATYSDGVSRQVTNYYCKTSTTSSQNINYIPALVIGQHDFYIYIPVKQGTDLLYSTTYEVLNPTVSFTSNKLRFLEANSDIEDYFMSATYLVNGSSSIGSNFIFSIDNLSSATAGAAYQPLISYYPNKRDYPSVLLTAQLSTGFGIVDEYHFDYNKRCSDNYPSNTSANFPVRLTLTLGENQLVKYSETNLNTFIFTSEELDGFISGATTANVPTTQTVTNLVETVSHPEESTLIDEHVDLMISSSLNNSNTQLLYPLLGVQDDNYLWVNSTQNRDGENVLLTKLMGYHNIRISYVRIYDGNIVYSYVKDLNDYNNVYVETNTTWGSMLIGSYFYDNLDVIAYYLPNCPVNNQYTQSFLYVPNSSTSDSKLLPNSYLNNYFNAANYVFNKNDNENLQHLIRVYRTNRYFRSKPDNNIYYDSYAHDSSYGGTTSYPMGTLWGTPATFYTIFKEAAYRNINLFSLGIPTGIKNFRENNTETLKILPVLSTQTKQYGTNTQVSVKIATLSYQVGGYTLWIEDNEKLYPYEYRYYHNPPYYSTRVITSQQILYRNQGNNEFLYYSYMGIGDSTSLSNTIYAMVSVILSTDANSVRCPSCPLFLPKLFAIYDCGWYDDSGLYYYNTSDVKTYINPYTYTSYMVPSRINPRYTYCANRLSYMTPSISVDSSQAKTIYNVGETLDTTNLQVTLTMTHPSDNTLTFDFGKVMAYSVTSPNMNTAGTKNVTVNYQIGTTNYTATYQITVT